MSDPSKTTRTTSLHRSRNSRKTVLDAFPNLELLHQDGSSVPASSALKGKRYILFYFAAHYLPSCQRFTPQLADFYDENARKYNLEVVFVSEDRNEWRMMDFFQNRCSNYVFRHNKVVAPAMGASSSSSSNGESHDRTPAPASSVPDSQRLRHRLHPNDALEMVTKTTTTTMSYNPATGAMTSTTTHAKGDASTEEDGAAQSYVDDETGALTNTTTSTTTTRTTAAEAISLIEAQEKKQSVQDAVLPGHKARLSAKTGYAPREPTASGHADWLALRYSDAQGAVGKWLRRQYKVRSAPRLVVVDAETGLLLVSEGKTMLLRDPTGQAFPWPGADMLIRAERESTSQPSILAQFPFLCLSVIVLLLVGVLACAKTILQ